MKPNIYIRRNTLSYLVFLFILSCLSFFMIFYMGPLSEYPGFDYFFHLRRFQALMFALSEGTFPFYLDYTGIENYGYFTKAFYPDVILIPFACIGLLTDYIFAYNFMIFTMTLLCGILMYQLIMRVYKNNYMAMVTSLLYTFCVYRIYDIYDRSALGEAMAFTFIPLVFWGTYEIIFGNYKKWYILAIGFSLLIFTHLISTALMFITLVIYLFINYKRMVNDKKRINYLILAAITTVFISAYYMFPFFEQNYSNTFKYHLYVGEITEAVGKGVYWGLLSGIAYRKDTLFAGIGIILTIFVLLRFFVRKTEQNRFLLRKTDVLLILGIIYLFLPLKIFPWEQGFFKPLNFIQFSWRLWIFTCIFFSIAGGYYSYLLFGNDKRKKVVSLLALVAGIIITMSLHNRNYIYLQTNRFLQGNKEIEVSNIAVLDNNYNLIGDEYLPAKVPSMKFIADRGETVIAKDSKASIIGLSRNKNILSVQVVISEKDNLELPLIYYEGYKAEQNGTFLPVEQSENGLVEVVAGESGTIKVYYEGTLIQKISTWISVISIILLTLFIIFRTKIYRLICSE